MYQHWNSLSFWFIKQLHTLLQDMEVMYFHAYIDGVDFVFIDSPVLRHLSNNIYGGNRLVRSYYSPSSLPNNQISAYMYVLSMFFFCEWMQDILKRMVLFCKAAVEVKPLALQYHNFAVSLYQFWFLCPGSMVCSMWRCLLWRWQFGFHRKWLAHRFAPCLLESLLPRSRINEIHTFCSCNPQHRSPG